ncbi:MAG: hypothetical protein JSV82_01930 [Planctomycetota bacterium]|nr:MAG: hypothetical protein JSV82_01930 [Planctomycetota bacterium]
MKPLVVLISILLVTSFGIIYAFAQPARSELPPHMRRTAETPQRKPERKSTNDKKKAVPDANSATVVDSNDPNAAKAPYQMFEGLEKTLEYLNEVADKETREWTRAKTEDRTTLAKTVQTQIVKEFNVIRELAVEEGAVKTTAAIDGLLMMRQERFDRTIEKLEDIRKRLREREEKRESHDRERRRERIPKPKRRDF